MTSIMDLAPLDEKVSIRGAEIGIVGLTVADFAALLHAYPNLRAMIDGRWSSGTAFDASALLSEAPAAVSDIIARGLADKTAGHDALVSKASTLTAQEQATLLVEIFKLTMPDGPSPFADAVVSLLGGQWASPRMTTAKSDTSDDSASSLPTPSLGALVVDMTGVQSGHIRRAS